MMSWTAEMIFATPQSVEAFKCGLTIGALVGLVLGVVLLAMFVGDVETKAYEQGVKDARKGWKGS